MSNDTIVAEISFSEISKAYYLTTVRPARIAVAGLLILLGCAVVALPLLLGLRLFPIALCIAGLAGLLAGVWFLTRVLTMPPVSLQISRTEAHFLTRDGRKIKIPLSSGSGVRRALSSHVIELDDFSDVARPSIVAVPIKVTPCYVTIDMGTPIPVSREALEAVYRFLTGCNIQPRYAGPRGRATGSQLWRFVT